MSVSIFGSSSKSDKTPGVSKKYVDSKFITLTFDFKSNVNKAGDVMNESLNMGANKITSSYLPKEGIDLINKGYVDNKFVSNTNYGHLRNYVDNKFVNKSGDVMSGSLDMGNNKISSTYIPTNPEDLINKGYIDINFVKKTDSITKNYVDTRYFKNSVGLVPILNEYVNKNGFIVSASSEKDDPPVKLAAFSVFSNEKINWLTNNVNTNFWIQIKCPEKTIIYKIALRGPGYMDSDGMTTYHWKVQVRDNDMDWNDLAIFTTILSNRLKFFNIPQNPPTAYNHFRLFFISAVPNTVVGLSYWQLYSLDPIM